MRVFDKDPMKEWDMSKEILFREEDLMSEEELRNWAERIDSYDFENDPLELLGRNRGKKKDIPEVTGTGPDDGDNLG